MENTPLSPAIPQLSKDEEYCENHFIESTVRQKDGRFCVKLPFRVASEDALGESYHIAKRRFLNLERKLNTKLNVTKRMRKTENKISLKV